MDNCRISGNFWDLSDQIFNRINDEHREDHVNFLIDNPHIAKLKKINVIQ